MDSGNGKGYKYFPVKMLFGRPNISYFIVHPMYIWHLSPYMLEGPLGWATIATEFLSGS
jgi:hypothetical protein